MSNIFRKLPFHFIQKDWKDFSPKGNYHLLQKNSINMTLKPDTQASEFADLNP